VSAADPDPDSLLSDADRALYRAKRTGRGRVELNNVTFTSAPSD
jgi:PleD family two-component response regulator